MKLIFQWISFLSFSDVKPIPVQLKIPSAKKLSPIEGLSMVDHNLVNNIKHSPGSSPTASSESSAIPDHLPWPPSLYPGFPPHYPFFPFNYSGYLPTLPDHFKFRGFQDHIRAYANQTALYPPFPFPPGLPPYHVPPRADKLFNLESRYNHMENETNLLKSAFDPVKSAQKPIISQNKTIVPEVDDMLLEKKKLKEVDVSKYQCSGCQKNYSTFSGLSKHKQFHCANEIKKEFNCKYCEKTYVSLGALKMHIRTHTLPCKCKLCGKAFSRPWLLQGHVRTHTGEKPFSCSHCARAFADRSNLRAHLQTHSDIKKYCCKKCNRTFSRMSLLLKHEENCGQNGGL